MLKLGKTQLVSRLGVNEYLMSKKRGKPLLPTEASFYFTVAGWCQKRRDIASALKDLVMGKVDPLHRMEY